MKIGAHISAALNVALAPQRAKDFGCECFQFFSRPPQGGKAKEISLAQAAEFKKLCRQYKMESYIHAPYFINLASSDNRIYYGSVSVLKEELERGSLLGVKYMLTHLGSAKDLGEQAGLQKVIEGLAKILEGYRGRCQFLIEMSAGAGAIIGDTFEEIAAIIQNKLLEKYKIGVCFDTAHAFASGYDLRDQKAVSETFGEFDKFIGLENLKLIHANDSQVELGARKDRHEHIGKGKIGLTGFSALVKFTQKQKINLILETPDGDLRQEDLAILKSLRDKKKT